LLASVCTAQVVRRVQGDGLVAWWPMEFNGVNRLTGNAGTFTGDVFWKNGRFGGGYETTNAATASLRLPSADVFNPGASMFTVTAWLKTTNANQAVYVTYSTAAPVRNTIVLDTVGGQLRLFIRGTNNLSIAAQGGSGVNDGRWRFVAGVRRTMTVGESWLDGQLVASTTNAAATVIDLSVPDRPSIAGNVPFSEKGLTGTIDDVRVYNRALDPRELAALFVSLRRNHSQ
jgi:hypothetical protein